MRGLSEDVVQSEESYHIAQALVERTHYYYFKPFEANLSLAFPLTTECFVIFSGGWNRKYWSKIVLSYHTSQWAQALKVQKRPWTLICSKLTRNKPEQGVSFSFFYVVIVNLRQILFFILCFFCLGTWFIRLNQLLN